MYHSLADHIRHEEQRTRTMMQHWLVSAGVLAVALLLFALLYLVLAWYG